MFNAGSTSSHGAIITCYSRRVDAGFVLAIYIYIDTYGHMGLLAPCRMLL